MKFSLKQKKRSAVSPVIATLLLIAIAVAAAIIVYAFVTGLIGGLTTTGGSSLVQVSGTLTVPSGSGGATLVVNVKNSANNPITSVQVTTDLADGLGVASYGGAGYGAGTPFTIYAASLPIGQSTSGVATYATGVTAGDTYTWTVVITFSAGSTQTQTLSVTAQV
jgi:flagellin-like protein